MRILLAEDEPQVARAVRLGLATEGYDVDHAPEGNTALKLAGQHTYDAILLDVMMPGKDGVAVLRELRGRGLTTPVMFLTSRVEVEDKVRGLDAGADDYLAKPFSIMELLARLRALLRRNSQTKPTNILRVEDLELDLLAHHATRAGERIELTRREFSLLEFLMSASPKPVDRTTLIEHVWDLHFDPGTNVVNVFIKHLREKIDRPGWKPLIHTVRGVGFAIHAPLA